MSHEISAIDRQQGLKQAWHKLTQIIPNLSLENCFLNEWEAAKRPLYREVNGNFQKTDNCEIYCTDKPEITLGKAIDCESYGLISNANFLKIVGEAIGAIDGAKVVSVGSVSERNKVFVSIELKELESFKAAGREFKAFLNFGHSFDQSSPFWVNTSNICTVCANTFGMNLREGGKLSSIKHTKNALLKLENVPAIVEGFLGAQAEFKAIMETLGNEGFDREDSRPFFAGLLSSGAKGELSTRRMNQVNQLDYLFVKGAGNKGETRADAFSAVTDWATHENAGGMKDVGRQIASSEFGQGLALKQRSFEILQSESYIRELVTLGAENLARS